MIEFKNRICRYDITGSEEILKSRGKHYEDYLALFHASSIDNCPPRPNYVVLEVNNYCNMRCKMCIRAMNEAQNTGHNMDIQMIDKFCDEIAEFQIPSVFLGGGLNAL